MFTWDIPLLPEEHFGTAVKVGMAPIRAMGFVAGTVASNVWENAVMKPTRLCFLLFRLCWLTSVLSLYRLPVLSRFDSHSIDMAERFFHQDACIDNVSGH